MEAIYPAHPTSGHLVKFRLSVSPGPRMAGSNVLSSKGFQCLCALHHGEALTYDMPLAGYLRSSDEKTAITAFLPSAGSTSASASGHDLSTGKCLIVHAEPQAPHSHQWSPCRAGLIPKMQMSPHIGRCMDLLLQSHSSWGYGHCSGALCPQDASHFQLVPMGNGRWAGARAPPAP